MGMNMLLERLRDNDKEGLFEASPSIVCYKTGIPTLDYQLGYRLVSRDINDNIVDTHDMLGVVGGSLITLIGKNGTAKTASAIKMAGEIVKDFDNAFAMHYDLEQACSMTRVKNITGFTNKQLLQKYILKSSKSYIEDIFDTVMDICQEKEKNKTDYQYVADFKNEFGQEVKLYQPTVVIIDSIPSLGPKPKSKTVKAKKGSGQEDYTVEDIEMDGNTYQMRKAKEISQFFGKLILNMRAYNITIICINHIQQKIEINPFAKSQAQNLYLKQDESLPGGVAPLYYANTLVKHVAVGASKATKEEDGYAGFVVNMEIIKSRTNISGVKVPAVYDQDTGFSTERTLLEYARGLNLVTGGRKNARYLVGRDDVKFNELDIVNEYKNRPEVQEVFGDVVIPQLQGMLSTVGEDDLEKMGEDIAPMPQELEDMIM